jgi:Flp pilus assembly protein TadD
VRYRLAQKLLADGKRDSAKKQLMQAWRAEPPFPAAGVDIGLMLLEDGKSQEALEILKQAAELLPDDPRAMGAVGLALIRSGSTEEGGDLLRRAVEAGAAEPLFFYEMALLSESRGADDDARRYYRAGLELMLEKARAAD